MWNERTTLAAKNNAAWCSAVCRAHGDAGEQHGDAWILRTPAPRYSSNLVATRRAGVIGQLAFVDELLKRPPCDEWSIKDSFRTLDLRARGFRVLFEAEWLWRDAPNRTAPNTELDWSVVRTDVALLEWETCWRNDDANVEAAATERQFPSSLLDAGGIAFFAGALDGRVVAVAAANRSGNVVGLSNVFGPTVPKDVLWSDAPNVVQAHFGGLPLVGYERDEDLTSAVTHGLERLGSLRVWIRG